MKLICLTLSVIMVADLSAVAYSSAGLDDDPTLLGGSSKTIWVDDDFIDDPPNFKWNEIQEGLDNASDGDTVYVFNGTYYETLVIKRIVNLTGENRTNVIVDGGESDDVMTLRNYWINVTGFTVKNSSQGLFDAGISLDFIHNCRIEGNNVVNNHNGFSLSYSAYNIIGNNTISANQGGISIRNSNSNLVIGNTISNNSGGVGLSYSVYNIVVNNTIVSNGGGLSLYYSDENIVANNNISYNDRDGVSVFHSDSNIVVNNGIYRNRDSAIRISSSSYETVINNAMGYGGIVIRDDYFLEHWNTHVIDPSNTVNGKPVYYWKNVNGGRIPEGAGQVILANCTNVVVENQYLVNASYGVTIAFSTSNVVANTTSSSNIKGMLLLRSGGNRLINNTIIGNSAGIDVERSHNTSIIGNAIASNEDIGIGVRGANTTITDNDISRNGIALVLGSVDNTLTNNRILNNSEGVRTLGDRITVSSNVIFSNGEYGIVLIESNYNTLSNLEISDHVNGIILRHSNNNSVSNTTISHSSGSGVYERYSRDNSIAGNTILSNADAIQSNGSAGTEIVNNTIQSNTRGINLYSSSNFTIYHNNIFHNADQAIDTNPAENHWHHPLLLEGNCWSDYTGLDDGSGVGKHAISGDGIGDTLIPHPGSDFDYYPLAGPKCQIPPLNNPPVANAGPDQTVYVDDVVQFDGSGSFDPDGNWTISVVNHVNFSCARSTHRPNSLALDGSGNPHVSYHDCAKGHLNHAKWTGTNWSIEVVDEHVPGYWAVTSIAIDSNNNPHIGYFNDSSHDLKYARYNGSAWLLETVDSADSVGWGVSLALDSKDNPHIAYADATNQTLKYAEWNGSAWNIEVIFSSHSGSAHISIAIDSSDNSHIAYADWDPNYDLVYLRWNGTSWIIEDVVTAGKAGAHNSIAVDSNDNPHISYFDWDVYVSDGKIQYASWNGTAWNIETVAPSTSGIVRRLTSLDLDSNDNPYFVYFEYDFSGGKVSNGSLNYADKSGGPWRIEAVDSGDYTGLFPSLTIDSNDNPHISYVDRTNNELKYAKKGKGIVSYEWDFDDGSPHGSVVGPTHVYYNPGTYNVTLTVTDAQRATDTDNCIITVLPKNSPPIADANGPYFATEGSPIMFNGSGSNDQDNDALQYRWDLNDDGIWDTGWSSSPYLEHTWGDDHSGQVALQVSDGEFTDTDTANITVSNAAPTVELEVLPIEVDALLRIAGEKWHDVTIEVYEEGVLVAEGSLVRYPGSPNDQMLSLTHLDVDISKKYSATVRYTPEDDPVNGQPNGANPCWIILRFDDGEELWLHHTFNVRHEEAHVWEVDLTQAILMHGIAFKATAYDPGADDLTFYWDFGDGTNTTSFYPNTNGSYPVVITETVTHAFPGSGTYIVTVTIEDDDGGKGTATFTIYIP